MNPRSKIVIDNLSSNLNLYIRIKYFPRLNRWTLFFFYFIIFTILQYQSIIFFIILKINIYISVYSYIIIPITLVNFYIIIRTKILN